MIFSLSPFKGKFFEYFRQIFVLGEYRGGKLIGMDRVGNCYYEITDKKLMFPCKSKFNGMNLLVIYICMYIDIN